MPAALDAPNPMPCCLVAGKALRGRGQEALQFILLNGLYCSAQQRQCLLNIGTPADSMPVGPGTQVAQSKPNSIATDVSFLKNCTSCTPLPVGQAWAQATDH